jgi:hypothetical protein
MANTPTDTSVQNYYYAGQLRQHMIQFMAIFGGLKVSSGKNDRDSETDLIEVPIVMESRDRVVEHIFNSNTQNKMLRLPTMSAQLSGLAMAPERMAGQNQIRRETKLKRGGTVPDDLQSIVTIQTIPYAATADLNILASNTQQLHECLEQILLLFNPVLQIQVSDAYGDRQKMVEVFLDNISLDENRAPGTDDRIMEATLSFSFIIYLAPPVSYRDNIIKNIIVRLQEVNNLDNFPSTLNAGVDPFFLNADDWEDRI